MLTLISKGTFGKDGGRKVLTAEALMGDLTGYTQKVFAVTDYCSRLYKMTLPTLRKADWFTAEVIYKFNETKLISNLWLDNGILNSLQWAPESILDYDDLYRISKEVILGEIQAILEEPGPVSTDKKLRLALEIERLANEINNLSRSSIDVKDRSAVMSLRIAEAKKYFDKLFSDASATELADTAKVNELDKRIKELDKKIKHLNNGQIATWVFEGGAAVAAAVGLILELEWLGIAAAIVVVIAMIASLVLDDEIAMSVKEINEKKLELSEYSLDLMQVRLIKTEVENLDACFGDAKAALTDITAQWDGLAEELHSLVQLLRDDAALIDKAQFQEMKDSIMGTEADWDKIVNMARNMRMLKLVPDLQVAPTVISITGKKAAVL